MKKITIFFLAIMLLMGTVSLNAAEDGLYVGYSEADSHGYTEAKVVLEDGDIVDVELTEFTEMGEPKGEDYSYDEHHEAMAELPGQFVEANDSDIDGYSGATGTSDKASGAVKMALDKAEGETSFDGKYLGVSEKSDRGSFGVAWVTVEDGEITDINLEDTTTNDDDEVVFKDEDTYDYEDFFNAKEEMPERFK
ncbi:MAG: FMN-binding protein, partial [Bacillota bacterium]